MKHVWTLTFVCVAFGVVNGLFNIVAPQICLALNFDSQALGLIGAGVPAGYALGSLVCGQVFAKLSSKSVLLGGALAALLAALGMSGARSVAACAFGQICFGVSAGAVWPFASAWMLDFQTFGVPVIRLLRHFNVAWTTGTACGMYLGGQLCAHGWVFESLYVAAGVAALVFVGACLTRSMHHAPAANNAPAARRGERGVTLGLLIAAVLANLMVLGTRTTIVNNYAELNQALGFAANRMGLLTAGIILSQLLGFSLGGLYERWLGLRRAYLCIAIGVMVSNLTLAFGTHIAVLAPAVLLQGLLAAAAFQSSILAATRYFAVRRTGTTFHESMVGVAGVTSLASGAVIATAKASGVGTLNALRTPFLCLAGLMVLVFGVQLILLSRHRGRRVLLAAPHE